MLKLFIKYKNESTANIMKILNISNNDIVSENYEIERYKGVLYGSGDDSIIYLPNYVFPQIKYIFNQKEYDEIINSGYEIIPSETSVGDIGIIKRKVGVRYVVSPMETIENIAEKNNISVETIMENNALKSKKLFIGQTLWVWRYYIYLTKFVLKYIIIIFINWREKWLRLLK